MHVIGQYTRLPLHTATTSGGGSKRGGQLAAKSGGQNDNLVVGMGDCEVESDNTYAEASLLPLQEHHANIMAAAGYNHHGEFLGQKNHFLLSLVWLCDDLRWWFSDYEIEFQKCRIKKIQKS